MKIGADPEVFLADAAGSLISAIGLIGGSKQFPRPLPLGDMFAVQEDNVAMEYNIPPAESSEQLKSHINRVMAFLHEEVQQHGLTFAKVSAASFPKEQLLHPAAMEFGCDPDYNAWTLKRNPRPKATDAALRSCGGHVHIGDVGDIDKPKLVRACDLYLGVPSVLQDTGELRKQLYGKAGAFRDKPYGVEYRTLSNYWVFEDRLIEWVWNQTQRAVDMHQTPFEEDRSIILDAIDNNNKEAASFLMTKYNLTLANHV